MNIAIKYCGGCNCSYNRKEALHRLQHTYSNHIYDYFDPAKIYDQYFIVCGCKRACVLPPAVPTDKLLYFCCPADFDNFIIHS